MQNSDEYVWMDENVFDAAWKSASVAASSSDILLSSDIKLVYGLCRPPGHHAARNKMGGFCYFNNAALAAFILREQDLKVGILDIDRHIGNGTYELVLGEDSIYFVSIHTVATYPWQPYFNETRDNVLSIPIENDSEPDLFFEGYTRALDYLIGCDVDLIIISLGLDCSRHDLKILEEKGNFGLYPNDFDKAGSLIATIGKKVLVLQEGGYNLDYLVENLGCFLKGLQNIV